jgi:hypothetical protein
LDLINDLNLDPVTAVGLLESYRRLTQACLPNLTSYLQTKYRMKQKDITEINIMLNGWDTTLNKEKKALIRLATV